MPDRGGTVADHQMKKEILLEGIAWGHLPRFMIEEELRLGRLLPIVGRCFPGVTEELVAARRSDRPHGPVANRLWEQLQAKTLELRSGIDPPKPSKQRNRGAAVRLKAK